MKIVEKPHTLLEYIGLAGDAIDTSIRVSPKRYHRNTIQATYRKRLGIPIWDDIAWIYGRDIFLIDDDYLPVFKTLLTGYEKYSDLNGRIILEKRKKPHWLEK